ncbi:MAG: DHH family phosphoesterase [Halobacterium sp.]
MDWITHEEDVWFDFRGSDPKQLKPNRFYKGTVDGFADFGVFVDLSPGVTGLLHRSELDRRLESLDWDPGDTVFVQVKNIRENGDIDLGWSKRQQESEFRGARVHDPEGDHDGEPIESDEDEERAKPVRTTPNPREGNGAPTRGGSEADGSESAESEPSEPTEPDTSEPTEADATEPAETGLERVTVDSLSDRVGDVVRVEGEIVGVRQTSGPTVFELSDETGVVDCAAFVEAGVRAYPEVEVGNAVRLDGEVELRRDELQIETEDLTLLTGEDAATVEERLADAMTAEARPDEVVPLADHDAIDAVSGRLRDAAEAIRRAVLDSRPVVVRHAATADGYVAGAALERAVLPLVREEYNTSDAEYHYFDRRPLDSAVYDMDAATNDVTNMLQGRDRFDEKLPLVVLVGVGSTVESSDGLGLLGVYGARRVVVDAAAADEAVDGDTEVLVNPELAGADAADLSTGALSANLAAAVNDDVRADLAHLPAVSYWESTPQAYVDLAADAGYDADRVRELREAIALEAYYQSYEDKRELITDLLFDESEAGARGESESPAPAGRLAGHVSEQFRIKLEDEVETARANLERREEGGVGVAVLDTDAYTHRFDFPPTGLLVDELHRRNREGDFVTVGLGTDELWLRSTFPMNVRDVAAAAAERVPEADVDTASVREGKLEFLSGVREETADAVVAAAVDQA